MKLQRGLFELALTLDIDRSAAIDEDVGNSGVIEQGI